MTVILSYIQTCPLQTAYQSGQTEAETSPDLGMSKVNVTLSADGVRFPTGECLDWASIEKISKSEVTCYNVSGQGVEAIQTFSQETNRLYSLMPTKGVPSILIAGFVMHRFKGVDPWQDTQRKIASVTPVTGRVLDTTTGLGYTAILAARTAEHVTTIEVDANVQEIARQNPWSHDLFANPHITQVMGDASEVVPTFDDESFSRVLHDPPALKLAGELYAGAFYRELYRVLRRGGRLFHYIGDPGSKSGSTVTHGVVRRLQEAGFSRIVRRAEAFGVVAYK